ncbi:putative Hydantoinase A/oxoprolinase domain-containing protein [Seiridium cardinale]|uniref:Hydantoinase A/oxoprolinase domain-containing protein n=1 Tax=Seiridium cardinale TaxID=138064 RepID=A0ABR2XQX9_9PEZI
MPLYRIGVDVGGTNTDAAILDITNLEGPDLGVLATCKAPTTSDITTGIEASIQRVLADSGADLEHVLSVNIGTTHFLNALIEVDRRRLDRVAIVRLCGPFTRQIPPFSDFPANLRNVLDGFTYYLDGGFEVDGREIAPLNPDQIRQTAGEILSSGVNSIALVGVFSAIDHQAIHEKRCREIMLQEAPELRVVCSGDIGPTGLLERENATILNAAILRTGEQVIRQFKRAMVRLGLSCPLYLSQNDGTLIEADLAAKFPIKTFASGATNSMTGAAFLAGIREQSDGAVIDDEGGSKAQKPQILVVDIGGTTTDVCALLPSGFPRQAPGFVEIGGVRTAFSMPEVVSIGLGGGSIVRVDTEVEGRVSIGPDSVGHHIATQAMIFGGSTLTTTDVVVALNRAQLGDSSLVRKIPSATIEGAKIAVMKILEQVIDKMRVSSDPVHILLVGGGSILVTDDLRGVDKCIRPIHEGAANAVGAAIAKVSGDVDIIEVLQGKSEKDLVTAACQVAIDAAVAKGALREDVAILEINKMPLQYTNNSAMRIQVKAAGKLAIPETSTRPSPAATHVDPKEVEEQAEPPKNYDLKTFATAAKSCLDIDIESYRPEVEDGVWYISEADLEMIATGCGILGTGGGGPTHYEHLKSLHSLRTNERRKMRVIPMESVSDDGIFCFGSWYGSPSVINERIAGGEEIQNGIDTVNKILGHKSFEGLVIDEIGGGNGLSAFPTGVHFDVPVVDGDAMGRAYPTMYHATFSVYGHSMTPCVLSDARGNASVVMVSLPFSVVHGSPQLTPQAADSPLRLESMLRTTAIELGLGCAVCANPLPGSAIKSHGIPNTVSLAWYLGRAVHLARRKKINYLDAIFEQCPGKLLYSGKIIDVSRHTTNGYTMGSVTIAPAKDETAGDDQISDKHLIVPFQNEYLYCALVDPNDSDKSQEIVCTVPDLISILGQDGEGIGSQDLRYGLHVNIIAIPPHRLWKTDVGIKVGGPGGFGLEIPYVGIAEDFPEAKSVIKEFGI